MALVNPQIAMSYRPTVEYQPRNALAEYAQIQSIVGGQRQAEMADMQMEALRRKERAISQIQAAAVKHGGPTDRREIAQAYIKSGVPEFMQIGLTMDKDLDELEAFDRIMGGGAGGAVRAAPSAAAAAAGAAAAPASQGEPVAAPILPSTVTARDIPPVEGAGAPAPLTQGAAPVAKKPLMQMSPEELNAYFSANRQRTEGIKREQDLAEIARLTEDLNKLEPGGIGELSYENRRKFLTDRINELTVRTAPVSVNTLAPAAAPVANAMLASAAVPAGAAPAGAAPVDPVAELRAKRDAFIRRGTPRALQAARSLDADIALLSRTTSVAPGSTVIGPDGKEIYRAGAAPSQIATLEAEIAALKKDGVAETDPRIQARRRSIEQTSGQSTELIRNYNAAVAAGFKGTIFDYEKQIKQAGRAITPPTPAAPVAVVDPATGNTVYVSREEALRGRMTPAGQGTTLAPKEIQKREATYPQATQAVKGFESKSESFIKDLEALRDHPGLSQITGFVAGRVPGVTAEGRAAQALYDKIVAKGGFQALQDMRDASKTGGALGNVSNQEGKQLVASFAAIDRRQDAPDVQAAIDQAINDIRGSQTRMREAYDETYSYRTQGAAPAAAPAPRPRQLSPEDKQALDWANSNPKDPRAAQIKARLGVQ
jgi:hypothetical protein